MPFGALFDVCRSFLGSIGDLPDRQRRALEGALAMGPAGDGDRFAIGAATLSLLTGDREAPLLVVIDDAQWLDGASAASLAFALRRLDADDVAVFIGLRAGEAAGFDVTGFPMLELARLSATDAVALAGSRRPVSQEQAQWIAEVSGGNPLAILELVASETSEVDGLVPVPAHVERSFASRVEQLPEETQEALLIAAVDDLGLLDVIGRATSLAALGPAEDAGLVQILEARLEFRHPLVRSAIYQAASPTERRRSTRSAGRCAPSGPGFSAGLASRQLRRRGRRGSCRRDGGRGRGCPGPAGSRRGGGRVAARGRAHVLVRTRGRGGSWLQAKRRGKPGPAIRPARPRTRHSQRALIPCCTPTSSGLRPEWLPSQAGLLRRSR